MSKGRSNFFSKFPDPFAKFLTRTSAELMPAEVQLPPPPANQNEEDEEIPELLKCPIGLNFIVKAVIARPCKHIFDEKNIQHWLQDHNNCPCCRTKIVKMEDNKDLQQVIDYCEKLQRKNHLPKLGKK